ncbi:MAG: peptidylprolyl isomerase [Planctomycetota bacterium]|jgi:parvulin-like peptidyl-prolyl isomerase
MAIVNGQRVTWGDLRPIVTELAGGQGLEEVLLDRVVQAEAEAAAIRITPDDIAREQQLLLETLSTDPNRSLRLLDALRSRQRLGPERYDALLWRNAVLRALVKDDVALTEPQVRRMYDIVYGERRQARLIIVQTLRDAQSAREAIEGGRTFTDVAVERSTDSSAVRGGLLEPISEADPGYPAALRRALWSTEIGSVTDPILLDDQYAILRLEQILPPRQEPLEQVRPELERMTRLQQERIAMDRLARELILDVSVTIFDESLLDSWQRRRQATGGTP